MVNREGEAGATKARIVLLISTRQPWILEMQRVLRGSEYRVETISPMDLGDHLTHFISHDSISIIDLRSDEQPVTTLRKLRMLQPRLIMIVHTDSPRPDFMREAVILRTAGFLHGIPDRREVIRKLRAVAEGEVLLNGAGLVALIESIAHARNRSTTPTLSVSLTEREEMVLRRIARGETNRAIADTLFVAESTVKTHVVNILGKLGVTHRTQAAVWATQNGYGPDQDPTTP